MPTMKVKKALNLGAVQTHEPWLVICCNVIGNRILESHNSATRAQAAALVCTNHDQKHGHHNQYVVRHRDDVTIEE